MEPKFTAIIQAGPPAKTGTEELPCPILVELSYEGPQLDNVNTSYICRVMERKSPFGDEEQFSEDILGHNLGDETSLNGIIVFRDIRVPSYKCECQPVILMTHTDLVAPKTIPEIYRSTHWFPVDPSFRNTACTLK
ncbi:hypothetical protein UA08_01262 [Talaromyces atroroseus]|uniref:Uncharacterized protein n=1 Tax=Talaromyces atroroseus TaxID=1441469 RepID=A0A1Q5QC99_TALAT|nr:hypothetical protein UA08_01262 [Talaromyces atroroseus]OKL63577.1 hypothetical protein UA08_01262 [Talaromyces atroroseus]